MRNWNDVTFYRPEKGRTYRHIDALFGKAIDWALIETHWQDMMQVVLSIQAGKILPSTLLRKLGSHSRQNKLNRAFREPALRATSWTTISVDARKHTYARSGFVLGSSLYKFVEVTPAL